VSKKSKINIRTKSLEKHMIHTPKPVEQIEQEIRSLILEKGAVSCGFSRCPSDDAYLRRLPTAISLAVQVSDAVVDEIREAPTMSYFHHYRTLNYFIDQVQLSLGLYLQKEGYSFFPIPASQSIPSNESPFSAKFSHKEAAVLAGLGKIGRSCLFLENNLGPRVRLGTVFTNFVPSDLSGAPVPKKNEDHNFTLSEHCSNCSLCIDSCPSHALFGNKSVSTKREELLDPEKCSLFMKKEFQHIGRGAVCGICMSVCPAGKIHNIE
jgi:epoxyqueuosine reductase